jgi:hypothetical protein
LLSSSILLDERSALLYLGITKGALVTLALAQYDDKYSMEDLDHISTEYRVKNYDHAINDSPVILKTCLNKFELLLLLKQTFASYGISPLTFNNFAENVTENPSMPMVMSELRSLYQRTLHTSFDLSKLLRVLSKNDFFTLIQAPRNPFTYLQVQPKHWRKPVDLYESIDIPGSFSVSLTECGIWHISDIDSMLYSMIILNCGSWGGLSIYDGTRRLLWRQPSAFTGSFVLEGYCKGGILIDNGYKQMLPINTTVNWRNA